MSAHIILASGSEIRAQLLRRAGLIFDIQAARVDEALIKESLLAEGAPPRDIVDALAETKARKVADRNPASLVIGCDQILIADKTIVSKPETPEACKAQLDMLSGNAHKLMSAAVIYENAEPVWRHVGVVNLRMRPLTDAFIDAYVMRNWDRIRHSVGGYKIEEEGIRLFSGIQGDYFHILGLPLLELLNYLALRGEVQS